MKALATTILTLLLALPLMAQNDSPREIDGITVVADRPLKEIGSQQTRLDSIALRENVVLSMADVLSYRTPLFIKSYGRATLSTVSFRGTSPSHTQVTWNGMRINSPMVGMTDFSTIPSYFIDDASLLHGTSSVSDIGGGLGGSVRLSTAAADNEGFGLQYIQGVGSFTTFDEFLRLTYGSEHWQVSTRAVYSSSKNDFTYRNHDKKENVYETDADGNKVIVDQYYPTERNRSGAFNDFHILQEVYYNTGRGDRFGLNAWYTDLNRELPMLTTDYGDETEFENRQRENTFRGVLSWDHLREGWKVAARAGYIYSWVAYDYKRDVGNGILTPMTASRSTVHTVYGQAEGEYYLGRQWLFTASLAVHQHFVTSSDKNVITVEGGNAILGYNKARVELSGSASVKWKPCDRFGISAVVREEMFGDEWTPVIPALFIDAVLSEKGNIVFKASGSRNFRFPSLNDMYFLPGGNPDLRKESGWSYDAGISFEVGRKGLYNLSGSATWFDSYVDDWIMWLPTVKGFFSPKNVKKVHAYGIETKAAFSLQLPKEVFIDLSGTFSWTPSINIGEPLSPADRSIGKQLPYTPELSATVIGSISWRTWSFLYKWCYYSERYTMSSNDITLTGKLPEYFMSDIAIEKKFSFKPLDLSIKAAVNNLFNEEYMTVLSRPMPGINFEIFVAITPKFR